MPWTRSPEPWTRHPDRGAAEAQSLPPADGLEPVHRYASTASVRQPPPPPTPPHCAPRAEAPAAPPSSPGPAPVNGAVSIIRRPPGQAPRRSRVCRSHTDAAKSAPQPQRERRASWLWDSGGDKDRPRVAQACPRPHARLIAPRRAPESRCPAAAAVSTLHNPAALTSQECDRSDTRVGKMCLEAQLLAAL